MRRLVVVFALLYAGFSSFGQTPTRYYHNLFWGRIGVADKFNDKLKWELYYQNRTQNDPTASENLFRYHQNYSWTLALYYQALKNLRLSFTPFCYFNSLPLLPMAADATGRPSKEFRWMLTAEHTGALGIFDVGHRYTFELRYRDLRVPDDYIRSYRLRYRGRIEYKFKNTKHPFSLLSYDEVFFEFGGAVAGTPAVFNQNRLFCGFNYEPVEHVKFNIGYIYLIQERPTGKTFDYSNVLSAAVTFEGLFSGKKKEKESISDSQPGE